VISRIITLAERNIGSSLQGPEIRGAQEIEGADGADQDPNGNTNHEGCQQAGAQGLQGLEEWYPQQPLLGDLDEFGANQGWRGQQERMNSENADRCLPYGDQGSEADEGYDSIAGHTLL
jgi:hypothetical protein